MAVGVIPKGMLPEVFQMHITVKAAADKIEEQLNVVGEMISANPSGVDLKVTIKLLQKQVGALDVAHKRAQVLLATLKKENDEPCSSCCAGCPGCCNCTSHVVKKRIFTVMEPANSVAGIVAVGASTFDDSCDKSINPLKIVGFASVVAGFALNLIKTYLSEQIAANQLNISKLEILNEKMGRFIESTNSMIQVYDRVDQYDGRPRRMVKDDLQSAIPEVFRQYVTPDALQNYVQVKYNTLPPRGHLGNPTSVRELTSGVASVRKSPFGTHSRRPSQERSPTEVRAPEKGKFNLTDKSSGGSNPGNHGVTQEEQSAVFVPVEHSQPELLLSPTHPVEVTTDVKQQQVADKEKLIQGNATGMDQPKPASEAGSQAQGKVSGPSDSTPLPPLSPVMSDPQPLLQTQELRPEVRPDSKESSSTGNGTGAVVIEFPSALTPMAPSGNNDGRAAQQTSSDAGRPKRTLWNWMGS